MLPTLPAPANDTFTVQTGSPHWYISFNQTDISIYGGKTTALVLGQMEYFLILTGDHREEFSLITRLVMTGSSRLKRCLQYIRDNSHLLHPMSDPLI